MIKNTIVYLVAILIFSSCSNVLNPSTIKIVTQKPTLKDYKIGEKWTFKHKIITTESLIPREGETSEVVIEFKDGLAFLNRNNGISDTIQISSGLDKKKERTPFLDWPLKVGKKWKYDVKWADDNMSGHKKQDAEVISFEEVIVDAGKFMAYKIEYKGKMTNSWGYDGALNDTYWYAPAINKNIKVITSSYNFIGEGSTFTKELIKYSRPQ